ncbi:flagellar biosynthesis anti-sigma factor FlgM [Grimontia hollisae]|uniref:Negative regulator of flagellin synthesis n=2 Tax=Grimontia hollisae TaxID=673 RepID=D0ICD0_GRIHO|nr:flagellar biosynthesis anti-sigma factor FlgM [Grimontia hollisae]AMG29922.1 flagellar biosynthesis anti-sigma factor FlgM [Grimontia hollisae]EEY71548.1 negative regulator of flagellin synthesis FlgM [Grimontia hollisae CIP 101886]MDF2185587.1 flagellar biosynthesis anti-sigma factor FlgM [Grimontia hollisae]STO43052.1 anti-sigma28 factor FlgM [Grimontia hollisae]STO56776.1 anti-sigma28 factor FlgM [Grimontia hollisae]
MASIDHLRSGQPLSTNRSNQSKTQSSPAENSSAGEVRNHRGDAFSMSDESRAIGALNQQMASETHFDSAKVAAIKAAIANGSYKVDADRLAENMMKHEDDLRGMK